MPLRIKLPSHDRIIINGAVLENAGDATTLIVHNRVDILRRKEVMSEQEASTPARRVYYSLQCAYMFDEERSHYITHALEFLKQYRDAAPSSASVIAKIAEEIEEQRFYGALKATNALIEHESERIKAALEGEGKSEVTQAEIDRLKQEMMNPSKTEAEKPIASKPVTEPVIETKKSRKLKS